MSGLRPIAAPFVAAAPAGARVRTRLRVSAEDEAVLRAAGSHLGSLAGRDLAVRCAEGRLDANGRSVSRAVRKRALTAEASSRWAGAITRASEDQLRLAERNLRAARASLQARVRRIEARLAVSVGGKSGRARGYATPAERHAKVLRLKSLTARLARADRKLEAGTVSVVRGGKALLRKRANLAAAGLTEEQWRAEWESARLFLTADGEKGKVLGNETIRWHPGERWLEIRLPGPLAHLANRPHGRYRLSCPVAFTYRGDEVAAQAAAGAVRYDITYDPARDRWYVDASWQTTPVPAAPLDECTAPGGGGRRQRRAPRRRRGRGGRERPRHSGHGPARPGRAARHRPGRAAAGRDQRPHRHRERARRARDRDRGPRLRRRPGRGARAPREPPLPRPTGTGPSAGWSPASRPGSSATG